MSNSDPNEKEKTYLIDVELHAEQLKNAVEGKFIVASYLHKHTSENVPSVDGTLRDLCEYMVLLVGFAELLEEIKFFPKESNQEGGENYLIPLPEAAAIQLYVPMMGDLKRRLRRYGFSLTTH